MIPSLDLGFIPDEVRLANIRTFITEKAGAGYDLESEFALGIFEAWFADEAHRASVKSLPITLWNLQVAYNDLSKRGLLPRARSPQPAAAPKLPDVREAGIAQPQPTAEEEQTLAKLADDPALSDHQRKQRDRKLALLAGQQRRALASLPQKPTREHPCGGDPPIRI